MRRLRLRSEPKYCLEIECFMNTGDSGATEMLANLSAGSIVLIALALTILRILLLSIKTTRNRGSEPEVVPAARSVADILESVTMAGILVFLIIRPFFAQAFFIPSASMENTILGHDTGTDPQTNLTYTDTVHDHLFANKLIYRFHEPQRGDIVIFKAPPNADSESTSRGLPGKENTLIKRLIGISGDTIEVKRENSDQGGESGLVSVVYRNGVRLVEPYIREPMSPEQRPDATFAVGHPLKLGPGQLFVMGDNRNFSNDSRFWGTLDRSRVMGKASVIFYPFNRMRVLH